MQDEKGIIGRPLAGLHRTVSGARYHLDVFDLGKESGSVAQLRRLLGVRDTVQHIQLFQLYGA